VTRLCRHGFPDSSYDFFFAGWAVISKTAPDSSTSVLHGTSLSRLQPPNPHPRSIFPTTILPAHQRTATPLALLVAFFFRVLIVTISYSPTWVLACPARVRKVEKAILSTKRSRRTRKGLDENARFYCSVRRPSELRD
jgi:hypothetical protein